MAASSRFLSYRTALLRLVTTYAGFEALSDPTSRAQCLSRGICLCRGRLPIGARPGSSLRRPEAGAAQAQRAGARLGHPSGDVRPGLRERVGGSPCRDLRGDGGLLRTPTGSVAGAKGFCPRSSSTGSTGTSTPRFRRFGSEPWTAIASGSISSWSECGRTRTPRPTPSSPWWRSGSATSASSTDRGLSVPPRLPLWGPCSTPETFFWSDEAGTPRTPFFPGSGPTPPSMWEPWMISNAWASMSTRTCRSRLQELSCRDNRRPSLHRHRGAGRRRHVQHPGGLPVTPTMWRCSDRG